MLKVRGRQLGKGIPAGPFTEPRQKEILPSRQSNLDAVPNRRRLLKNVPPGLADLSKRPPVQAPENWVDESVLWIVLSNITAARLPWQIKLNGSLGSCCLRSCAVQASYGHYTYGRGKLLDVMSAA